MAKKRIVSVPFEHITVDPQFNARTTYDPEHIAQLKTSIQESGLLQPLGVTASASKTEPLKYFLVYGFCRYYALQKIREELGSDAYATLDVVLNEGTTDSLRERNFKENVDRRNLKPHEIADAIVRMTHAGLEQRDIGARLGRPQSWVSMHYKVRTKLTPTAWNAFRDGELTLEQALNVADLPEEAQDDIVGQVQEVDTRAEVKKVLKSAKAEAKAKDQSTRRTYSNKGRPASKNIIQLVADASFEAGANKAKTAERTFYNGVAAGLKLALGDVEFDALATNTEYTDTDYVRTRKARNTEAAEET